MLSCPLLLYRPLATGIFLSMFVSVQFFLQFFVGLLSWLLSLSIVIFNKPTCLFTYLLKSCVHGYTEQGLRNCSAEVADDGVAIKIRGIKNWPTIIRSSQKYRDTGIPRYFMTPSIVDNFCKNPTVQIICSALTDSLCHMPMILCVNFLPLEVVLMLIPCMLEF